MICESMIESVLYARQRYLRPQTGVMMPSKATLFVALMNIESYYSERVDFWKDVYGVKMTSLVSAAKHTFFDRPIHERIVTADEIVSEAIPVYELDMATAKPETLEVNLCVFFWG